MNFDTTGSRFKQKEKPENYRRMKKIGRYIIAWVIGVLFTSFCWAQTPNIDIQKAAQFFKETKMFCEKDNGMLWGRSLNVPILFLDTNTRTVIANYPDKDGVLQPQGKVYLGHLPDEIQITKGTIRLGGKTFAMLPWPLPQDPVERQVQIIHEAFHSLQPALDLTPQPYYNGHMDKMEARLWLKLEWEALEQAVLKQGNERKMAVTDAILFRNYRRALFTACKGCENRFEIHEGMAEYTAQKICRSKEKLSKYLTQSLEIFWDTDSFVNSFAYCSGPLYGFLLDESGEEWRTQLSAKDDLAKIIQKAYDISLPKDPYLEAEERSVLYRGALIMGEELDRDARL